MNLTDIGKIAAVSVVAGVVFVGVAIREWTYYNAHPYAHGVSGLLTAAALAGAAVAFALLGVLIIVARRGSEVDRLQTRLSHLELWHHATLLAADKRDVWHWRALGNEEQALQAEARAQEASLERERQEQERTRKQRMALAAENAAYKRRQQRLRNDLLARYRLNPPQTRQQWNRAHREFNAELNEGLRLLAEAHWRENANLRSSP